MCVVVLGGVLVRCELGYRYGLVSWPRQLTSEGEANVQAHCGRGLQEGRGDVAAAWYKGRMSGDAQRLAFHQTLVPVPVPVAVPVPDQGAGVVAGKRVDGDSRPPGDRAKAPARPDARTSGTSNITVLLRM